MFLSYFNSQFLRTEKQWRVKKKKSINEEISVSLKYCSFCAEDRAGLEEITYCFWHNPLGFEEDMRVESISLLCCIQQQRLLLETKGWGSVSGCTGADVIYFHLPNSFLHGSCSPASTLLGLWTKASQGNPWAAVGCCGTIAKNGRLNC